MVGISFARPVGPYADTKELEYISALHQSSVNLRQNGSIEAKDIMHFLSSRHGVKVEEEVVMNSIILELAGSQPTTQSLKNLSNVERQGYSDSGITGMTENTDTAPEDDEEEEEPPEPVVDLCQVTAMLLIPFFRSGNANEPALLVNNQTKLNQNGDLEAGTSLAFHLDHHQEMVGHVLDVALRNILGELKTHTRSKEKRDEVENHGVVLTTKTLRHILEIFGEFNVPKSLLEEMIKVAQTNQNESSDGEAEVFLNKAAFLQALTSDTQLYDPKRIDTTESTHFDDARKASTYNNMALYGKSNALTRGRKTALKQGDKHDDNTDHNQTQALAFRTVYMANHIDNSADTYRSSTWFTLVWVETVLIYLAYLTGSGIKFAGIAGCDKDFGCSIARSLILWILVFFQLMIMGFTWVFMASLGNTTHATETSSAKMWTSLRLLIGIAVVCLATIVPFFVEVSEDFFDTKKKPWKQAAYWSSFIGGILIIGFQLLRLLGMFFQLGPLEAGGMEKKEKTIKGAATNKVLSMVEHAVFLHEVPPKLQRGYKSSVSDTVLSLMTSLHASGTNGNSVKKAKRANQAPQSASTTNKALLNFHRMQDAHEDTGGVMWTVQRLRDRSLLQKEGIYLHGRLMAVNITQFFVVALMITTFFYALTLLNKAVGTRDDGCTITLGEDDSLPKVDPDWNVTVNGFENILNINETHWSLLWYDVEGQFPKFNGTAFDFGNNKTTPTFCFETYMVNITPPFVYDNPAASQNAFVELLQIQQWEWKTAAVVGLVGAIMGTMGIACVYVPSFVSSVLKLRSGVMPSLKGDLDGFGAFRKSPDQTSILFGTNFWGCFFTAAAAFLLFGVSSFVCFWSVTREYIKSIVAGFIGMGVTIGIKVVIMKILRGKFYSAFYRKRPAASNIMNVILECWSLGLSIGTVTSRLIKLMVVTALYVGRIDTPMLAPGVGNIGSMKLDPSPNAFKVDLLSHEAHRHPYIERLGLLYLLKLHNGKGFGSRAGAYWRLLFVLAVMPWMRNYRVKHDNWITDSEDDDEDEMNDMVSVRRQVQNELAGKGDRGDEDFFSMQLEMDLTRRAYDKISQRNNDLKKALLAARDKVRELKREKKELKTELRGYREKAHQESSSTTTSGRSSSIDDGSVKTYDNEPAEKIDGSGSRYFI